MESTTLALLLALSCLLVTLTMGGLWVLGLTRRNFGYVDAGWAANFALIALLAAWLGDGAPARRLLISGMVLAWSLRLTVHLWRRLSSTPEDGRYARLRARWAGPWLELRFLGFFLAQGLLNLLLATPLLIAVQDTDRALGAPEAAAFALFLVSLAGESLADRQLARFRAGGAGAGAVCEEGLWAWSRHPNYFFECGIWLSFALFALPSPGGVFALVAPALMFWLLLEVTGVKPAEQQALLTRGEAYRDYQRRVPPLVPRPPGGWSLSALAMRALDTGRLPDALVRLGIRRLLAARLREESAGTLEQQRERRMRYLRQLRESPLAVNTREANEQHYEVPAAFFEKVLGPRLKYSCGYFEPGVDDLGTAEERMLALTVERAGIVDGERVLELGCGWGSLSLYMAGRFPRSRITAVSNSRSQREFIEARAAERGLVNLEVITCDINALAFEAGRCFDRIVSVEMFEHLRNYEALFARLNRWLTPGGALFVHIFTHRLHAYPFEARDASDFMARHFFTGGQMPSDDLLLQFQGPLRLEQHWHVDGTHYQRTAEAWLANMDRHREALMPVLAATYGGAHARRWWCYWRVFFMACAELWGYREGREWLVSHYRFRKPVELRP